jgi:hypothetical protein
VLAGIGGIVTDRGIAGAIVELMPPFASASRDPIAKTETDTQGYYFFEAVKPGEYSLIAVGKGCVTMDINGFSVAAGDVVSKTMSLPCQ